MTTDATSFIMTNLNLYFGSKMTDTLSTLVELRFSFLPHGHEVSYEAGEYSEYERVDTTVNDPSNNKELRLGGVAIEQAHLTWKPADVFGIVAGYYLTPYGIWNIDHGTPLLIPIREPYMQYSQIVPLHQLGLQLFGRAWPADRFYLDYAITLSNGRGPIDTVQDLDENKAVGLRLRGVAEGDNVTFALGGYGYFGKYTDIKRVVTSFTPFAVVQETTESYAEFIGALDLLLEFYGVRLQSEYIRKLVRYDERPPRSATSGASGYRPNYIHQSVYGLLAWTLPLEMAETDDPDTVCRSGLQRRRRYSRVRRSDYIFRGSQFQTLTFYNFESRGGHAQIHRIEPPRYVDCEWTDGGVILSLTTETYASSVDYLVPKVESIQ